MALADIRREYSLGSLDGAGLAADPLAQFNQWFLQASAGGRWRKIGIALYKLWHAMLGHAPMDVNAMTLATVDPAGRPSTRSVLLKSADERGFVFYTNYDSRKGCELAENPNAALTFYWADLGRQVCIAGAVSKLSHDESEAYFKSRPRGSRLAAWASPQSSVIPDRAALEKRWNLMAAKFPGEVSLPPNWGGYVLKPERIEFWQGRLNRLHDRFCYTRQPGDVWKLERLAP
jgi:pyridoxamine 5'-phosphate oxidase